MKISGGKKIMKIFLGIVIGAGLGFLYYRFIGCSSGACPITRNPISSMVYGALIGGLLTINI